MSTHDAESAFDEGRVKGSLSVVAGPAHRLDALPLSAYRIRCRARSRMLWKPEHRGQSFRGALGYAFRRLVCHDLDLDCRECPLVPHCPYPAVFRAQPRDGMPRLSSFTDIPQPFVLAAPTLSQDGFEQGEAFDLGLTLAGVAATQFPYFLMALRNLADEGLGPSRARFDIVEVASILPAHADEEVFRERDTKVRPIHRSFRARDLHRPGDEVRSSLRLRFVTPMEIKDGGRVTTKPEFGPLFRRLRDRANALASFFGDGPFEIDFRGLGDLANTVRLVEDGTIFRSRDRTSSRTGQTHPIEGFSGEAAYEGDAIAEFMPFLRLAEWISVGKHATFGNGRVEVVG